MTRPTLTGVDLAGAPDLPLLLVGPSLGTSARTLWSGVASRLADVFRVVGWDLPGHDGTPAGEPFTMAELASGVRALAAGIGSPEAPFAYAGDSIGGAVGLQLMLDAPEIVPAAVLCCTGARIGTPDSWADRATTVRASGTPTMVTAAAERWFAPGFMEREPASATALLGVLQDADAEGYAQACEALAAYDVTDRLGEITGRVHAVAGAADVATPPDGMAELAIATGGSLTVLDGVAHQAPVEAPDRVADLIRAHLSVDPHAAGMQVRRDVLGDAHVDRANASITPLTADFQDLITRYAWGTIWTRPGLTRRERSIAVLTALIARGHHEELAMHVRAALRNGLTRDEIGEVILQSAIYCGVPDANTAFRIAQQVLDET